MRGNYETVKNYDHNGANETSQKQQQHRRMLEVLEERARARDKNKTGCYEKQIINGSIC